MSREGGFRRILNGNRLSPRNARKTRKFSHLKVAFLFFIASREIIRKFCKKNYKKLTIRIILKDRGLRMVIIESQFFPMSPILYSFGEEPFRRKKNLLNEAVSAKCSLSAISLLKYPKTTYFKTSCLQANGSVSTCPLFPPFAWRTAQCTGHIAR